MKAIIENRMCYIPADLNWPLQKFTFAHNSIDLCAHAAVV